MIELTDVDKHLLDAFLNNRDDNPFSVREGAIEHTHLASGQTQENIQTQWKKMEDDGLLREVDHLLRLRSGDEDLVKEEIERFLSSGGIDSSQASVYIDDLLKDKEENLRLFIKILGVSRQWQQKYLISFYDYDWNNEVGKACEYLVNQNLMFRHTWHSKKHSYRNYIFRNWPFDFFEILRAIVLQSIRVEALSEDEWRILEVILLAHRTYVSEETLCKNTGFTPRRVREIVVRLEERGLIHQNGENIEMHEGFKDAISIYYNTNEYPRWKLKIFNSFQHDIINSLTNLEPFMFAKQICESRSGQISQSPIKTKRIPRTELANHDEEITGLVKLGLAISYRDEVVILTEVIGEIEDWLRSCFNTSVVFIPANDHFLASGVFRDIFGQCQEYAYIQDAYIGEETFQLLEYLPQGTQIKILTGIKLSGGEDPYDLYRRIQRFVMRRKGRVQFFFMGNRHGSSPFHDRLIMTESGCWHLGTSLKDIGKGRETTVTEIPIDRKDEVFVPAFDRWWSMDSKELQGKGLERLSLNEWWKLVKDTSSN